MSRRLALAALLAAALGCASTDTETRTNVSARGVSGAGVTVVGEVVSFTSDSLVVATDTGRETIQIDEETRGREHLMVGRSVTVDVRRSDQATVATEIEVATEADGDPD